VDVKRGDEAALVSSENISDLQIAQHFAREDRSQERQVEVTAQMIPALEKAVVRHEEDERFLAARGQLLQEPLDLDVDVRGAGAAAAMDVIERRERELRQRGVGGRLLEAKRIVEPAVRQGLAGQTDGGALVHRHLVLHAVPPGLEGGLPVGAVALRALAERVEQRVV